MLTGRGSEEYSWFNSKAHGRATQSFQSMIVLEFIVFTSSVTEYKLTCLWADAAGHVFECTDFSSVCFLFHCFPSRRGGGRASAGEKAERYKPQRKVGCPVARLGCSHDRAQPRGERSLKGFSLRRLTVLLPESRPPPGIPAANCTGHRGCICLEHSHSMAKQLNPCR